MKTLTVRQPWASLLAAGIKRVENRTWKTDYRGPLAIHAAQEDDNQATADDWRRLIEPMHRGAIIAVVDLIDIVQCLTLADQRRLNDPYATGPFCWILEHPRRIDPIPCAGQQGLWECGMKIGAEAPWTNPNLED